MAEEHLERPEDREENKDAGYEIKDANIKQVVLAGLGIAAVTVIACFAMYFLFNLLKHGESQGQTINPMAGPRTLPPNPRLQEKPWEELQKLRAREEQILNTYGWVNKGAGTTRIPIDKAMDAVAQKGLPARAPGQAVETAAGSRQGQPPAAPGSLPTPQAAPLKEDGSAQRQ